MHRPHSGKPRRFFRSLLAAPALVGLAVAASCSAPAAPPPGETVGTTSQAESTDSFGIGSGRSGPLTVTASGTVVNTYAPILSVATGGLVVTYGPLHGAPGPFAPGDLVLIWRTAGLTSAPPGDSGPFDLGTDVGGYEFGRVKSVNKTAQTITFTNPLSMTGPTRYATGSQLVRVPEYTTVDIHGGASIRPYPWDGTSGGIVFFLATGAVTNAGSVSADGAGFRGGQVENASSVVPAPGCSAFIGNDEANPCGGAHKGEGLDATYYALATTPPGTDNPNTYGSGNSSSGAGGGDARNAGGGGGGHFGAGGSGGDSALSDGSRLVGGFGGAVVSYDPTSGFVSLGGGGGAGDEDQGTGTDGAPGGGVVIIRAAGFTGNGSYTANGGTVTTVSGTDGAGGGGAGGAVVLFSTSSVVCGSASASGGAGGSGGSEPDGPGGGGGGGVAYLEGSDTGSCPLFVTGGASGTTTSTSTTGSYGASPGNSGQASVGSGIAYGGGACTPALLGMNQCGGCVADTDCPTNEVCDGTTNTCGVCSSTNPGSCTGTTSACSVVMGTATCVPCNGDLGSTAPAPCLATAAPYCVLTGPAAGTCAACATGADCKTAAAPACSSTTLTCTACDGDMGTSATAPCAVATAPYCEASGACGVCTSDADCAGNHAGPRCDTTTGACGSTCATDAQCPAGTADGGATVPEWCDTLMTPGVCGPKVANGQPIPGGACSASLATHACISGACDPTNNECGVAFGGACTATAECQSGACATTGPNAGKCEACATDADCPIAGSQACSPTTNECVTCTATNTAACTGDTPVCNLGTNACVACGGDLGSKSAAACSTGTPVCFPSGICARCQGSEDCIGAHTGPVCDTSTGACTTSCGAPGQCPAGEWCSASDAGAGLCEMSLADGTPLPTTPASLSKCTVAVGAEVCTSGVCDPKTNACGPPPDAGVSEDAGKGHSMSGVDSGIAANDGPVGTSVEGGACAVGIQRSPGSRGGAWLFGLAVAVMALARSLSGKARRLRRTFVTRGGSRRPSPRAPGQAAFSWGPSPRGLAFGERFGRCRAFARHAPSRRRGES